MRASGRKFRGFARRPKLARLGYWGLSARGVSPGSHFFKYERLAA